MRTKEEVIKSAWGELFNTLSDKSKDYILRNNGQVNIYLLTKEDKYILLDQTDIRKENSLFECTKTDEGTKFMFRPKSLSGLDDNNSWIKIESEEDLPKEPTECFVYDDDGDILSSVLGLDYPTLGLDYKNEFERFKEEGITHYQPIIKPEPPLY